MVVGVVMVVGAVVMVVGVDMVDGVVVMVVDVVVVVGMGDMVVAAAVGVVVGLPKTMMLILMLNLRTKQELELEWVHSTTTINKTSCVKCTYVEKGNIYNKS